MPDFRDKMITNIYGFYKPIDLGNGFMMSVQASEFFACFPRKTGLPVRQYKSMEVAIISPEDGLVSEDNTPELYELIKNQPWASSLDGDSIMGYMPIKQIQQLFDDIIWKVIDEPEICKQVMSDQLWDRLETHQ